MKNSLKTALIVLGMFATFSLGLVNTSVAQDDPVVIVDENGQRAEIPAAPVEQQGQSPAGALPKVGFASREGSVTYTNDRGVEQTVDLGTARSVSVTQSSQVVVENGRQFVQQTEQMIVVDADGQRHKITISDNGNSGSAVDVDPASGDEANDSPPKNFMIGLHCGPVPELLQAHLRLEPETGLVVEHVLEGKPAAIAGIEKNDVLLYADDQQLRGISDLIAAANRAGKEEVSISITLVRAGEEIQVDVSPVERQPGAPTGILPHQFDGLQGLLDQEMDLEGVPMPEVELNLDGQFNQLRDQIELMRRRMQEEMDGELIP